MKMIDINCDLGESFGAYKIGNDAEVLNHITSANIACGFHAGDPHVMQKTVLLAKEKGVAVGAHPGFQDLIGFGRRNMSVSPEDIYDMLLYQLGALNAFCKVHNVQLHHVKPHGALYNVAAVEPAIAEPIVKAIKDFDPSLILYALSGSELVKVGQNAGLKTASEVFADRTYQPDGTLTPRTQPNALIHTADIAISQVLDMVKKGTVTCSNGEIIPIKADTICIHGDNEQALQFANLLKNSLAKEGIIISTIR